MLPIRDSNKMATCNSATFSLSAENTGKNLKKFLYKNSILYHYQYHICYNFTENTRFIRYPLMGRFGASSPIWFMFALPTVTIIGPLSISKIRLPASSNNKNKIIQCYERTKCLLKTIIMFILIIYHLDRQQTVLVLIL